MLRPGLALTPALGVLPFALLLLAIAALPLALPRFWARPRNRGLVAAGLGLPVLAWTAWRSPAEAAGVAGEYLSFVVVLATLYGITGGVVVRRALPPTPGANALVLLAGAVLASAIGTTGASMLLVRPLLRANAPRRRAAHVLVFFIFVVSNAGGLLTPLGDPPLYLGYLRGVPFAWTLRLWPGWALVCGALVLLFYGVDRLVGGRDGLPPPPAAEVGGAWLSGWRSLGLLTLLVAWIAAAGAWRLPAGAAELGMLLLLAVGWRATPAAWRRANGFDWEPMAEVAVLFAGIFATMPPALALLNAHAAELGLHAPWQFFWATGLLSSVLDNAPTYLTFAAAAAGLAGGDAQHLGQLTARAPDAARLAAISMGAVLMGANTYLGNGPNLMVRAVAERAGVRMPSFGAYMAISAVVLLPLFALVGALLLG